MTLATGVVGCVSYPTTNFSTNFSADAPKTTTSMATLGPTTKCSLDMSATSPSASSTLASSITATTSHSTESIARASISTLSFVTATPVTTSAAHKSDWSTTSWTTPTSASSPAPSSVFALTPTPVQDQMSVRTWHEFVLSTTYLSAGQIC